MAQFDRSSLLILPLLACLSACSIYPLPEDVMFLNSDQIETIVRCETRDAIRAEIKATIAAVGDIVVYDGLTGPQMLTRLTQDPEEFRKLDYNKFVKILRDPILFYKDASISYDFTIDTSEVNSAGVTLDLLQHIAPGTNTIGLTAKNDRTREVKRHFRAFDSFDSLARGLTAESCKDVPAYSNPIYPLTGLIRIRSLVHGFIVQNQLNNLGGDNLDYDTPQMADTITFTTKSTGNIDPTFSRNPITNRFVASSVGVTIDNSRQDMDTVIVLIRLPVSKTGLPRFDEIGRIALPKQQVQRAVAADALDRQRDYNAQDSLEQIGTSLSKATP